jgi:hypothetical protein
VISEIKSFGSFVSSCVKHRTLNHDQRVEKFRTEVANEKTIDAFLEKVTRKEVTFKDTKNFYKTMQKRNIQIATVEEKLIHPEYASLSHKVSNVDDITRWLKHCEAVQKDKDALATDNKPSVFKKIINKIKDYAGPILATLGLVLTCVGAPLLGIPLLIAGAVFTYPKAKELVKDVKESYDAWKYAHFQVQT